MTFLKRQKKAKRREKREEKLRRRFERKQQPKTDSLPSDESLDAIDNGTLEMQQEVQK